MKADDHPHLVWVLEHFMACYTALAVTILVVLSFVELL